MQGGMFGGACHRGANFKGAAQFGSISSSLAISVTAFTQSSQRTCADSADAFKFDTKACVPSARGIDIWEEEGVFCWIVTKTLSRAVRWPFPRENIPIPAAASAVVTIGFRPGSCRIAPSAASPLPPTWHAPTVGTTWAVRSSSQRNKSTNASMRAPRNAVAMATSP